MTRCYCSEFVFNLFIPAVTSCALVSIISAGYCYPCMKDATHAVKGISFIPTNDCIHMIHTTYSTEWLTGLYHSIQKQIRDNLNIHLLYGFGVWIA